ncbi:MAG: 6-phosphogluconolactonase [Candidatus Saccharibacteria bacterium]|nr:6-phosphogluconolactonase [Candidatus Saccharibacteria bacterium]
MNLVTEHDDTIIVQYLATVIHEQLELGETVLWLVPGGSAMGVATEVLRKLEDTDTSGLCITLTDERYGEPGHADENWTQLMKLGFAVESINAYRVLRGETAEVTAADFSNKLAQLMTTYSYKIGLFGIGVDGHTAGILPHSPAVHSEVLAMYYEGVDFGRVTVTPKAIALLDEVVVYAHGAAKHTQIGRLLHSDTSIESQPAQALKLAAKGLVFSEFAG